MVAKRKSDVAESSENKRARIDTSKAEALVHSILANPLEYPIPEDDDEIRQSFIDLAKYASYLREMASPAQQAISSAVSAAKSSEQLAEAAEKVAKAARSGIKKQMTVRVTNASAHNDNDASFRSGNPHARRAARNSIMTAYAKTPLYLATYWALEDLLALR